MVSRFEQFCSSVSCIFHHVQKIERVEMAKYGLKGPHAQCLLAMSRYPQGITASRLCEVCDKDKAAISRTVAELEHEGLVEREAAQRVDARARFAVEKAGAGLTDAQREVFYAALNQIAANLQVISDEGLEEQ